MKLRSRWLIKVVSFTAAWCIRLWMATLRYRLAQLNAGEEHPISARRRCCIYSYWHEDILFPTVYRRKVYVLISHHSDGELIAQVSRYLRYQVVRGSSSRGGAQAARQLIRCSKQGHLFVTPDGPRGPRRRIQPGLIFLASHTGLPIIPNGVAYSRAWRLRSWDRFAIPWPWTAAYAVVGEAIFVPPNLSRAELERYRRLVEQRMLAVTAAAERWASGGPRPRPAPAALANATRRLSA